MKCMRSTYVLHQAQFVQYSSKGGDTMHRKACSIHAWAVLPCLQNLQTLDPAVCQQGLPSGSQLVRQRCEQQILVGQR